MSVLIWSSGDLETDKREAKKVQRTDEAITRFITKVDVEFCVTGKAFGEI